MKKISTLTLLFFIGNNCFSQGWLASNGNLYASPYDSVKSKVGIGTNAPSAKLHVNGTLRFQGLANNNTFTKLLAIDANGNVSWRDVSTISGGSGWSLTGNSGTIPSTNFIGTKDNQRLVFRTNNVERMTIITNGHVGINNSAPSRLLSLQGTNISENAEIVVKQISGSTLGAYLTLDNTANGGKYWSIGSTGSLNSPGVTGALEFYELGFGTRMMIDKDGKVGIGIGNGVLPTANLHAKGTVRFEGLTSGSGSPLVIDANGNLHVGSGSGLQGTTTTSLQTTDAANQLSDLKKLISIMQLQIDNLSNQITLLKTNSTNQIMVNKNDLSILPNPSKGNTIIQYAVKDMSKDYSIKIYDLSGRVIKTYSLSKGQSKGSVNISSNELRSGVYGVSLLSQSEVIQNKFLITD